MSNIELLWANGKLKNKFLNNAIHGKFNIINTDLVGDTILLVVDKVVYQISKKQYNDIKIYFNNGVYIHHKTPYKLPDLQFNDDSIFNELCGYFKGKENFGGVDTAISNLDTFRSLLYCIIHKNSTDNFTSKQIYKCGMIADYLICDYIKIACYNILCIRDQLCSKYYCLKLLNYIKCDEKNKWTKQIDFIMNKCENKFEGTDRMKRKIHKVIKLFTGIEICLDKSYNYIYLHDHRKYGYKCHEEISYILTRDAIEFVVKFYSNDTGYLSSDYVTKIIDIKPQIISNSIPVLSDKFIKDYFKYSSTTRKLPVFTNYKFNEVKFDINLYQKLFYGEKPQINDVAVFNDAYMHNCIYMMKYIYNNYNGDSKTHAYFKLLIDM